MPFATLALMILVHVREGIDLPYFDDWRDYAASTVGTYSPSFLFQPINDTLYPVGKLLDSIFLDALDGNTLIYQTVSMAMVLGAILWLTWKLLLATAAEPVLAAGAFISSLLILQADSYWGRQYVAYHQTIPLICLLGIFWLVVVAKWRPAARMTAVFLLGLIAGGAYISGAFAGVAVACVFLAVGLWRRHRRDLLGIGMALGLASLITSVAQAYVIVVIQHGQTHRPDTPWATPLSLDFWVFVLGKIARSLALPAGQPLLSLIVASLVTALTIAVVIVMIVRLANRKALPLVTENRLIVTVALAAAIFVYLMLIAAGRTNMRSPDMTEPLHIFQVGFARFHFFWITLFWPWLVAALLTLPAARLSRAGTVLITLAVAGCLAIAVFASGMLNYRHTFAESAAVKERGLACMQESLISAGGIICPELYPANLNPLYAQAVEAGAPFVHAAPPTLRRHNQTQRVLLFGPDQLGPTTTNIENVEHVTWDGSSVTLVAAGKPTIEFTINRRPALSRCRMLNVNVNVRGQAGEPAQLFFMSPDGQDFSETQSQSVVSDGENDVNFTVSSREGFANRFRLDPITGPGTLIVSRLAVRCLLP